MNLLATCFCSDVFISRLLPIKASYDYNSFILSVLFSHTYASLYFFVNPTLPDTVPLSVLFKIMS